MSLSKSYLKEVGAAALVISAGALPRRQTGVLAAYLEIRWQRLQ
jgi:hypothetical protein